MVLNRFLVAVIAVTLLVSGCKKDPDPTPTSTPGTLTANAGLNQTAQVGITVTLDGSASKDSDNKPFTYQWSIIQKPAASTVTLGNSATARPSFVPDQAGEYAFEVTISNGQNKSSDKVTVIVTPTQAAPLSEQIRANTVLEDRIQDPAFPDYVVDKKLDVKAQLTLKPGVVIAFARDAQFNVTNDGGSLIAQGEAAKKIRLVGKEAVKGSWQGLWITSESSANVLENVEILHGGGRDVYMAVKAGLTLSGKAQLSLKNSLVSQSDGYGLHAGDGSTLREFVANTFSNNTESGAYVSADNVKTLDSLSVFSSNNGRNVIEVLKSNLSTKTTETVWKGFADKTPYRILTNLGVQTGLRLNPGVVLQLSRDVSILVDSKGYLTAVGTATRPITFGGVEAGAGQWRGLHFSYSASLNNKLDYVNISGGGSSQLVSGQKTNIAISGSTTRFSIKNSVISQSAGYGIFTTYEARNQLNADAATANKFENNAQGSILIEK
ncbi:right-handed parallel beta-helix repeat-containing protein [Spirosoma sp. HMF4905]|uniref:Right-handed parallel beta-helix repeat-containing protein n=1 Tax=Spirosoma arboris TaxID=2682092 RepID=A0A7K1SBG6_9BACT|nr:right-handed parallel beta-helix repeat-containing protein [Spirosoma arboris]MVM31139.1 right-handed parallel beta-helix repeat-containing protein [Spirosoma arboris]